MWDLPGEEVGEGGSDAFWFKIGYGFSTLVG